MSTLSAQFEFIKEEIRGAWRFRWIGVAIAWGVALAGWLFIYSMPNIYEAQTRVYVQTTTELRPLLQGIAIDTDIQSQLELVRQALLSTPSLTRMGSEADLLKETNTPSGREQEIEALRKNINLSVQMDRNTGNFLYSMSVRNPDREKSLHLVTNLLDTLIKEVVGTKRSGQDDAQQFLQEQIADYESRLSADEERLADFKRRNMGLVPGEAGDYFSRMQTETRVLETAQSALRDAEVRRAALASQLRGESPYSMAADSASGRSTAQVSTSDLDTTTRLAQAEARLQELLLNYTEQHPEVIALKESIGALQERQQRELAALKAGNLGESGGLTAFLNPVHQQIQIQLNQADLDLATLKNQIADQQRRVAELRKMADTAPEVEAEYARLNRDYGVTRAQYQSMVERLERARVSDKADETGTVKFNKIDPPFAKLEPVAPKRGLLVAAALILGLVAGAGTAYLMNLIKPVFQNVKALAEATGLRVLGMVSLAKPPSWHAMRVSDTRRVIAAVSLLLVACAAVIATGDVVASLIRQLTVET